MRNSQKLAARVTSKREPMFFIVAVGLIIDRQRQCIQKNRCGLIEVTLCLCALDYALAGSHWNS
jgi:hypothetical protein